MNDPPDSPRLADLEDLVAARTAELKTLAERLQLINEVAGIGVWEWDLVADRHRWDSRLYALYGLHEEDGPPTHATWSARVHPDDLPGIEARLDALFTGPQDVARDEFRVRWPDGTVRFLAEVCKIERDAQTGASLRVYGISWDITEQKRAEDEVRTLNAELEARVVARTAELAATTAALHQSEQRFRYAMEATSDGIWDWNSGTGAVYYSPGYARMLGYAQDELAPQMDTWLDLLHPEERAGVIVRAQHPLGNSGYRELEFRMRTKAGGYRWVLSRGKVIERAADGTPRRVVGTHIDITERKETELELRRYRQIVEVSTEKLFFLDRDLRYQVVNPAYADMYLRTPAALRGRAMAQVLSPQTWAQVHPHLEAVLAGEPQHFRIEAQYPDGSTRHIEADQQPFWQDGEVQGIVSSLHDLTEMQAVQSALEAERAHLEARVAERTAQLQTVAERLRLATEAGNIGVFDMDMTTGEIVWDAKLRAVYGVPEAAPELSWQTWLEWVAPEHRGLLQDSFARILRGEEATFQGVVLVHCPDGQDRYIASRARLLEGAGGASRHLVGINWDVTAERQAVAALEASEAKARAVIDASPVPLAIADESGPVHYLNAAFVQTFGYTLDDLPTMDDWRRLAYPDPVERARVLRLRQERMAQVARVGGTCEPMEVRVRGKDGTLRTVMTCATRLGGEERLNTLYDITDLKQAQAAAEQAARAKSDFLAHMSHEIRTPLNAVLGLAQVLDQTALDPDQRALLGSISAASRSLLAILNDILDLSKIEAGRLSLEVRPFDLAALLAEIDDLLGSTARHKGLRLSMAVPPEVTGGLLGDPVRLEQVLVNLIGNAIKFTDHGEVRLRIDPLEVTEATLRLRFAVTDTGIGMTPEARAGIFAPFTQADASITRRFGGTGLGLSICKRLVELMGGEIGAESQEGLGSTFWFELPCARTAQPLPLPSPLTPAPAPAPGPARAPAGSRLAGLHLLVVDDGAMNRLVAERMLAMEGARATLAVDGQAALDCLRAGPQDFDAVLMDVQMPVMDGLTATRLMRTQLGLADLPIIALTAGVLPAQQEAALAAGMNAVLIKPLDLERLVALVSRWVRPQPGVAPRASPEPGLFSQTDGPAVEEFPEIAGIDRAHAARLLAGNRALFLDLLERFAQEFADVVAATRQALAAGDLATAARQMHTLKSGAGTLGALDLSAAAQLLEGAIERGTTDLDERLAALDTGITTLIAAGAPWRRGVSAPRAAAAAAQPAMDAERLDALRAALRGQNLDAFDDFEALQPKVARILVVDDSAANIVAVRGMLGPDYAVSFATSGPQSLGMLAQGYRPDLILLDVMMPEMDGYAVCAALKADPATRAIPVLFITARGDPQSETRALSAGGLDFIHKPLNAAVLRARVGLHLELCRQAQALSTANAELSQHRDHLEGLVYARTQALAAALDAAQSADRAKGAFLLTVGHELHTPLHQIMGILLLVSKRLEDARLRDWLTKADAAAQHLLRLIDDILHYVESESQELVIASADFELAAWLTATERLIRPAAQAKGLELVVAVEPAAAAWLKGDAARLARVLWNLLDNAVKFSEHGRITLTVRHSAAPGARCELRCEVTDQGIGMTPEVQEKLFALFEQGDSGLTRRYGGTGLGLALCKRLVARMAGEIGFDSTPGEGSRFWFSLRLPVGAAPTAPAGGSGVPDGAQVNTIIATLEDLLSKSDFAVLPRWAESQPILAPLLGARLAAIDEAIVGFEFDTALRQLREARAARAAAGAGPETPPPGTGEEP